MAATFCTSGAALLKAGANVQTAISGSGAAIESWIEQGESFINTSAKVNFTDVYATLNDDVKKILEQAASDFAAMYIIQYDISSYLSKTEVATMLNVLSNRLDKAIKLLKEKDYSAYVTGA